MQYKTFIFLVSNCFELKFQERLRPIDASELNLSNDHFY
ncbi:hypothetical protein LLB_0751 [Legionella longbeachae D-4968]|nr:hypothetical protein LLB_0751 [Legionella longbeachae D-4968]